MMLKVDIAEGPFLADVGFGACLLDAPLQLRTDLEQRTAMGTFRLSPSDGLFSLSARQPAGWPTMYVFDLQPQIQADYELGNWYTSTSPLVPFSSMLIMERLGREKRYKLIDRTFLVEARDGDLVGECPIGSAEELQQIVDETFGVNLPASAEEIFRRIGG